MKKTLQSPEASNLERSQYSCNFPGNQCNKLTTSHSRKASSRNSAATLTCPCSAKNRLSKNFEMRMGFSRSLLPAGRQDQFICCFLYALKVVARNVNWHGLCPTTAMYLHHGMHPCNITSRFPSARRRVLPHTAGRRARGRKILPFRRTPARMASSRK